jgi:hypothetical protein
MLKTSQVLSRKLAALAQGPLPPASEAELAKGAKDAAIDRNIDDLNRSLLRKGLKANSLTVNQMRAQKYPSVDIPTDPKSNEAFESLLGKK